MARRMKKTYSQAMEFQTFEDRFEFLKLTGVVGEETFGRTRFLNQALYRNPRWKSLRNQIIFRDRGCDLACEGYEIPKYALVHHINPITEYDILNETDELYDPENLITVGLRTHNALHYGDIGLLYLDRMAERNPNDTCPWKE